jgi:L-fuculose-phosphate aldolase
MSDIKNDLVRHYAWLRHHGCNDSHSGNASVRDGDTIWVTPTGACADTLQSNELIACTMDGSCGDHASFDAKLHIEVYKQNAKTSAVFHSHGPHTIALTMNGQDFTPEDFEGKLYFPTVPVHSINFDDYTEKSPNMVANTLSKYRITVVRGHGVYACAESINLAYKWTCSLEHSAKIAFLYQQIKDH